MRLNVNKTKMILTWMIVAITVIFVLAVIAAIKLWGGSGLGLPTTRKIIEAHGGTLSVQSEPGRGTQFTIELPAPRRITGE